VPVAVAVNVTEQLAVPVTPATRAQVVELNEPAGPVSVKVTVPVGVVGLALVSVTVAVHNDPWLTTTGLAQETMVFVLCEGLGPIDSTKAGLVLVAWVESPPYAPVIAAEPLVLPVKVTEQLPETKAHVVELNEPVTPTWLKVTVPVGVVTVPGDVSVTVAVHVVGVPIATLEGEHETAAVVERRFTVTLAAALVLVL